MEKRKYKMKKDKVLINSSNKEENKVNNYTTISIKINTLNRMKRNIPFKLTFNEFINILCFNIENNIIDMQVFDPHQIDDKDDQET